MHYRQFAIFGAHEVQENLITPEAKRFTFPKDSDFPGENWRWYDFAHLNEAVMNTYREEGYHGMERWLAKYHTFFPIHGLFHWVIVTSFGEKVPFLGPIAFCPFANNPPSSQVKRYALNDGDRIFVPKDWGNRVLALAKSKIIEVGCFFHPNESDPSYWVKKFTSPDSRENISAQTVFELGYNQGSEH